MMKEKKEKVPADSLPNKSATTATPNAANDKPNRDKRQLTQAEKLRAFNLDMAKRGSINKSHPIIMKTEKQEPTSNRSKGVKKEFIRPHSIAIEMPEASSSANHHGTYANANRQSFHSNANRMSYQPNANRQSFQLPANSQSAYPNLNRQSTQQGIGKNSRTSFNQKRNSQSTTFVPVVNRSSVKLKQVKAAHRQSNVDQKAAGKTGSDSYGIDANIGDFEDSCYEIEDLYARRMSIRTSKSTGKRNDDWNQ
ncbi:hypothetical protein BGX27_006147 [Mortierella sp. AM989]|nr:hypothetical protein BGX27_006147 [Mortierella sp. AM989]